MFFSAVHQVARLLSAAAIELRHGICGHSIFTHYVKT